MTTPRTVLLLGATGRTGRRALAQLLRRGVAVRAIVRARNKLPSELADHPALTTLEASVLTLSDAELATQLRGCDAVVSCLGHVISLRGIFGAPRDLVTRTITRVCRAISEIAPPTPMKLVLMGSVSVNRPGRLDTRRGGLERALLWLLRGVLPPARDNQRAADFLLEQLGLEHPFVHWVVVRPDALQEGDVTAYTVHEGLVDSLWSPGRTNMANVAHMMCELVTDAQTWATWRSQLPVVVNTPSSSA